MNFFLFIVWFLLAEAIIFTIRFFLRPFRVLLPVNIVCIVFEILIAILFAFLGIGTDVGSWPIAPLLYALYIAMFVDGFAQILYFVIRIFIKKKRIVVLSICSNFLAVCFLIFGMINSQVVSANYLSFSSSKLNHTYKVTFVSDLHVCKAQPLSTILKTIESIKNQNADFNFIGGDLIDKYTLIKDMEEVVSAFSSFSHPVYYIRGNHDADGEVTLERLENKMLEMGIHVVVDEYVYLAEDLTLLGRNDLSYPERKKNEELINPYPSTYLIAVDHQPFAFKENCKLNIDLQLSGHTHAGQLFPLNWIYEMVTYSYGVYKYENSYLNVSSGGSGWRVPLRTSVGCQYDVITLSPKL